MLVNKLYVDSHSSGSSFPPTSNLSMTNGSTKYKFTGLLVGSSPGDSVCFE